MYGGQGKTEQKWYQKGQHDFKLKLGGWDWPPREVTFIQRLTQRDRVTALSWELENEQPRR